MDQFVRSQNVERYRRLLERVTDESDRQQIINLLAEERQKQKRRWRSGLVATDGGELRQAAGFAAEGGSAGDCRKAGARVIPLFHHRLRVSNSIQIPQTIQAQI
jgi:hypothetical protein